MTRSRGLTPPRSGAETVVDQEYLELLDATGRMLRPGKPGVIPAELPPLLERLGKRGLSVNSSAWGNAVRDFSTRFGHFVGRGATLVARAAASGR